MIQKKAIFKNLFTNHTITPERLYNFAQCVSIRLNDANKNGDYTAIITELDTVLEALFIENSNVDRNLTLQVTKTRCVDELMAGFIEFMKDVEPVIARVLGGRKSAGYHEFYPQTVMAYDKVNKTNLFLLTGRVQTTAEKYNTQLGEKLTGELQAFGEDCKRVFSEQKRQMATVRFNRNARNKYFVQAQWVLTAAVHYAAFINRSDETASHSFFPFDMLYPKTRHKIKRLKGELNVLETGELPNLGLITTATITIKNVCGNAHLLVWMADREEGITVPDTALVVKPLGSKQLTADMLKDMAGKRVLVKNGSSINNAHYEIAITGLKKEQTLTMENQTEEEVIETNDAINETNATMVIAS